MVLPCYYNVYFTVWDYLRHFHLRAYVRRIQSDSEIMILIPTHALRASRISPAQHRAFHSYVLVWLNARDSEKCIIYARSEGISRAQFTYYVRDTSRNCFLLIFFSFTHTRAIARGALLYIINKINKTGLCNAVRSLLKACARLL